MGRRSVITEAQLREMVDHINDAAGTSRKPYIDGVAQLGNYHISFAYGGVSLHQIYNKAGGIVDVFRRGHMPKRDLYNLMYSFTPEVYQSKVAS